MSQSHLTKPTFNPETSTAPAPASSGEPSSLLAAIARILLLRRTAGRPEPVAPSLPHNDNASPEVEWAMQMMN